jgi:hypothetical protein
MTAPATIVSDLAKGTQRLLAAPRDLPGAFPWREPGPSLAQASETHRALFKKYLAELQWAVDLAVPWWNAIVARRVERGEDFQQAVRSSYELRPAGPASRLEVVGVVRSFWLQCASLNAQVVPEYRVPPEVFLLQWLRSPGHELALTVLAGMPFWPIGFDADGYFC